MSNAATQQRRRRARPRVLGTDGKFQLFQDAMGVPGFHVAVNCFSPSVHRRLFEDPTFSTNPQPFVHQQDVPIKQTILHPTRIGINGSWPDDWHRVINAVRDSGLFEQATIPDCAYGLTYEQGSKFPCHWDGRGKWGEYVIVATLGAPCTVTFQHAAPKVKPVDPSRPWDWSPPDPTSIEDSYWTRSLTDEEIQLSSYSSSKNKRRLWQLTMTLPPNSMYVMSGPSRYDWRHGINHDANHPVPTPTSSYVSSTGAVTQIPANTWLFPEWNKSDSRRCAIFRSTKCFSDLCLDEEKSKALDDGDYLSIIAINKRIDTAHLFKPQDQLASRDLTEEELRKEEAKGMALIAELKQSGVHRLRFAQSEVMFSSNSMARAAGDVDAPSIPEQNGSDEAAATGARVEQQEATETVAFSGNGNRLGHSYEQEQVTKVGASVDNAIPILDSDDEDDGDQKQPAAATSSCNSVRVKEEAQSMVDSNRSSRDDQASAISAAGRAALQRFKASKKDESLVAIHEPKNKVESKKEDLPKSREDEKGSEDEKDWQCSLCTLLNKPTALQCDACQSLRYNNDGRTAASASARGVDQYHLSSALAGALANAPFSSDSGLAPGHAGRLRNKHAYLSNDSTTSSKRQKTSGEGECFLMGSQLIDNNPGAYNSGGWIWCNCPEFKQLRLDKSRVDKEENVVGFQREFREREESGEKASQAMILSLAKKYNVVHGKWLLRVTLESVEDIWPKIRDAVLDGKLGSTAKISESPEGSTFMICVYTNDFTDRKEVLRVRQAIHSLDIYTKSPLYYKPDCVTYLEIYAGDRKKLRTTIYSCGGGATKERKEDFDCTTLISADTKCAFSEGCPRCYPKCIGL